MIKEIELLIGKKLPSALKDYFQSSKCGGYSFPLKEPTPFGDGIIEDMFLLNSEDLKDDEFFEMGMMWMGENVFGDGLFFSFREKDFASIYYFEHDNRCFWKDELFYETFPNLSDGIVKYLQKRRDGEVPEKEEGYENFYLISDSFEEFISLVEVLEY